MRKDIENDPDLEVDPQRAQGLHHAIRRWRSVSRNWRNGRTRSRRSGTRAAIIQGSAQLHRGRLGCFEDAVANLYPGARQLSGAGRRSAAGTPAVLDNPQHPLEFPDPAKHPEWNSTNRRLTLAKWMVSPDNPLVSRVFVNRVWQWHFGEGIVRTVDDFGTQGAKPTHPELLDYLTRQLRGA